MYDLVCVRVWLCTSWLGHGLTNWCMNWQAYELARVRVDPLPSIFLKVLHEENLKYFINLELCEAQGTTTVAAGVGG